AMATSSPADEYQVGSGDFPNSYYFLYPLGASSGSAQYKFTQIMQFNPQGDATRVSDSPTTLMEVGLQPAHGTSTGVNNANFAVLQVAGIGGQVITYRP
ncbi:MAG TPA: hypothetical protein VIM71_12995, partial [Lacunisphaera sp.]